MCDVTTYEHDGHHACVSNHGGSVPSSVTTTPGTRATSLDTRGNTAPDAAIDTAPDAAIVVARRAHPKTHAVRTQPCGV